MRCWNCGKNIPFNGRVCPWCHAEKEGDEKIHIAAIACATGGVLVGYRFGGILTAAMLGGLGVVVGWIVGGFIARAESGPPRDPP